MFTTKNQHHFPFTMVLEANTAAVIIIAIGLVTEGCGVGEDNGISVRHLFAVLIVGLFHGAREGRADTF